MTKPLSLPLRRPMPPRDPAEPHRAATPLELLFDLVFVIAIAAAAAGLHHAIAEAHAIQGLIRYAMAFFAIWWAWMNYTWFASAYDNDDTLFRLLTMVIMAGALTMASGIAALFDTQDFRPTLIGYIIMRLAMILLWVRAARHDPARRTTALRYAAGILLAQIYWVATILAGIEGQTVFLALFAVGMVIELVVPAYAERALVTPWHRHHIIERYGLLNIIVLGETLLAGSMALRAAGAGHFDPTLVLLTIAALVIVFAMWWLYFAREEHLETAELPRALIWGYGHVAIFASGAAVGAGFAVLIDVVTHHAHITERGGSLAVAIPLSIYLAALWFVRDRFALRGLAQNVLPLGALALLGAAFLPHALILMAVVMVICVAARSALSRA